MSKELKPCPFCGCSDTDCQQDTSSDYEHQWSWWINCMTCDAGFECCDTEKQAIEKWNKRFDIKCAYPECDCLTKCNP